MQDEDFQFLHGLPIWGKILDRVRKNQDA